MEAASVPQIDPPEPFISDPDFKLYVGDTREVLTQLPAESVHMCVTSPPYWGLRDYGTAEWTGGDDPECDHLAGPRYSDATGLRAAESSRFAEENVGRGTPFLGDCGKCGAVRTDSQIGLESQPDCLGWVTGVECGECYVCHIVQVFRAVKHVLRSDGTVWLNIGDSYANTGSGDTSKVGGFTGDALRKQRELGGKQGTFQDSQARKIPKGLKAKDLVGIPWRVAFALQADGWWLRSDNIWEKPNPMPESVQDRTTKAHEYIFMLTKSGTPKFWMNTRRNIPGVRSQPEPDYWLYPKKSNLTGVAHEWNGQEWDRDLWSRRNAWEGRDYFYDLDAIRMPPKPEYAGHAVTVKQGMTGDERIANAQAFTLDGTVGRNKPTVWEIATESYSEAHFATYPTALVEPCIGAGSSERGACGECGAPYVRIVERHAIVGDDGEVVARAESEGFDSVRTVGWRASCGHSDAEIVQAVVLDPFMGSATTAFVARKMGRAAVGTELNEEYATLCAKRLQQQSLFA